ncbi:MAG: lipocalin-like domain-containing protein [Pseudomonadales bacterium]
MSGDRAGFAGLGTSSQEYVHASSTTSISFPEDHGPHPDFRIEWWYLTANLENENHEPMGIQWTLFRQAQQPEAPDASSALADTKAEPWATDQLWMAHMALSHGESHRVAERFARGASVPLPSVVHQAGVTSLGLSPRAQGRRPAGAPWYPWFQPEIGRWAGFYVLQPALLSGQW